jgi:excisionase family DNA binding protein
MSRADLPPSLETLIQATASATADAVFERWRGHQAANSLSATSPLLSVKEASSYIKRSRSELNRLEHAGVLTPKRFGRRVFYARADLDEYIRNGGST